MLIVAVFAAALYLPSLRNGFVWDDVYLVGNPDVETLNMASVKRLFTTNFWDVIVSQSGMYRPAHGDVVHDRLPRERRQRARFSSHQYRAQRDRVRARLSRDSRDVRGAFRGVPGRAFLRRRFPCTWRTWQWISGRTDILATLFMLASLLCYALWRRRGGILAPLGALVCAALATAWEGDRGRPSGVVAMCELMPRAEFERPAPRLRGWPIVAGMVALVFAYLGVRRALFGSSLIFYARFTHSAVQAVAFTFSIVAHYTYKLVWPFRLDAESDFYPPDRFLNLHTLVGILVVGLAVTALVRWRRQRAVVFAIAVIGCGLAPVLNILPVNQVLAERFLYFPSIGYVLLVSLLVARAAGWRRIPLLADSARCWWRARLAPSRAHSIGRMT
jgi:hypothetical protein